jgi:pimeloyl-ACP methyl ester carboxylesterase
MPVSRANGVEISYETAGCGPAMVFIHPLPFDHNVWLYQQARFASSFRTIAMDLRGWGASGKPTEAFTLEDMGRDIMALLREEGVTEGAVVVGCSIGSKIALMLACDHPDVFGAAILVGGNSGLQNQFDHRIAGYRDHAARGDLHSYHVGHLRYGVTARWADTPLGRYLIEGFADRGRGLNADCIAHVFRALTISDITPKLPSYRTPTMVVNGEHDGALPAGTRTASLIHGCEHVILPGTGHCCFIEDPESFDAHVIAFLRKNDLMPA